MYTGQGRSNFFRVRNEALFKIFMPKHETAIDDNGVTNYALFDDGGENAVEGTSGDGLFEVYFDDAPWYVEVKDDTFSGFVTVAPERYSSKEDFRNAVLATVPQGQVSEVKLADKGSESIFVLDEIEQYLADDSTAVFSSICSDKRREVFGTTAVITHKDSVYIDTVAAISIAAEKLGIDKNKVALPSYDETVAAASPVANVGSQEPNSDMEL